MRNSQSTCDRICLEDYTQPLHVFKVCDWAREQLNAMLLFFQRPEGLPLSISGTPPFSIVFLIKLKYHFFFENV